MCCAMQLCVFFHIDIYKIVCMYIIDRTQSRSGMTFRIYCFVYTMSLLLLFIVIFLLPYVLRTAKAANNNSLNSIYVHIIIFSFLSGLCSEFFYVVFANIMND